MPRQRSSMGGGGRAPSRPTAMPSKPATPQQTRSASTAAHPPATQAPPPQAAQSSGGGMLGNIASTAIGVGIGSSVGHMIGGMFGGGSAAPAEAQQSQVAAQGQDQAQNNWGPKSCETDAKSFTKCLDENQGNMQICGWYLEQLKACQSAASQY